MRALPPAIVALLLVGLVPAQQAVVPRATIATASVGDEADGEQGEECTVGVAVGRATADGRPLLWKNRDAQKRNNVVSAFADGRHPYLAICDAGSTTTVWGGANAAGFCIMNSVSRDLPQGSKKGPGNGSFMKLALQRCVTVDDFEALLRETNTSGRRTRANFGVIDAAGGAAFFEAGHLTYERFDADAAPSGILVRTNFATTAKGDRGRDRFVRAEALCRSLPKATKLDHAFLLQQFCRDLEPPPAAQRGDAGRQDVRETIHRQTTVAAMVFHGVAAAEDPRWTTMWAILGQPLFSVAVPCWPAAAAVAPELAGSPHSALCDAALRLQEAFYAEPVVPPSAGSGDGAGAEGGAEAEVAGRNRWLLLADLSQVRPKVLAAEAASVERTRQALEVWRKQRKVASASDLLAFHAAEARAACAIVVGLAEQFAAAGVGGR